MSPNIRHTIPVALLGIVFLSACGSDLNGPLTDEEVLLLNEDVAQVAADGTADDIALMTVEADQTMRPGFGNSSECIRGVLARIRCAERRFGDLTITREVSFFDADGIAQEQYDPSLTETINFVASIEGSRTRGPMTLVISRERNMTVSGLSGDETERIWNGVGSSAIQFEAAGEDGNRSFDLQGNVTFTDVVIAEPREGTWPLSGTITREMTAEMLHGEETRTVERTITIEFNGTQFVTVTVNGATFTMDLTTHEIVES